MTAPEPTLIPIARSARSVVAPGPRIGRVARSSTQMVARLGVGTSMQDQASAGSQVAALPWGVWPREADDAGPIAGLDGALASYAAMLRRKKAPKRRPAKRGIPLVARRAGGTEQGAFTGPGGLARTSRLEEIAVASPEGLGAARRPAGAPSPQTPSPGAPPQRFPTPRRAR